MLRISPEGNDYYPLPPDYPTLSVKGQRQARVNACRQWLLPGTPEERAEARVISTWYFDQYYLHPDDEADFDPLFYDMTPLETPSMHWDLSRLWATSRMNVALMPRGGAKTTHTKKDMILCLVTAPAYSFVYATSTHDNTKHTGQSVKDQCHENSRIQDDFGPDFGGTLKPARGNKPTGVEYFYLNNGSWLRCVSAESRLRGLRPRRFRLDDPEYDERASTSMATIRAYMDKLLFKVAIPMTLRAACGIDWTGTFVSKRHFLWHALSTIQTPEGIRAQDPRFNHWSRLLIRAAWRDDSGALVSCWPEMWPSTIAEKHARGLSDHVSIEEMPSIMGTSNFNGEMLGNPGTTEEQFFKLDTDVKGRHAYWYESVDDALATSPHQSSTLLCWKHPETGATERAVLSEFLKSSRLFLTVDTAYTESASSDRRCCTLMAVQKHTNVLFVLDMWSDRKPDHVLTTRALELAQLWRCPSIHIEVVKDSFKLYKRFQSVVSTRLTEEMGLSWVPSIRDLRPGTMTKTAKIETLDLRFEHSLIKLPVWKRYESPAFGRLFEQIEGFNPEADDGGLDKDDEIDTVAMSLLVLKGRRRLDALADGSPPDPLQLLKDGKYTLPGGSSIGMGLPWELVDSELTSKLLESPNPILTKTAKTRV